jgi:hypothetical protein
MKIRILLNEEHKTYGYGKNYIPNERLEELFRFFHLSSTQLHQNSKTFTFNPRVPKSPYEDEEFRVIEDDFTPRISLATKIMDAADALGAKESDKYYVYACDIESRLDDDIDAIPLNLQFKQCQQDNKVDPDYGEEYKFSKFVKKYRNELGVLNPEDTYFSPRMLPNKLKKKWTACVPDAGRTNEYWSIKDTKMYYIGRYQANNSFVQLSWQGKQIINAIEKQESSS